MKLSRTKALQIYNKLKTHRDDIELLRDEVLNMARLDSESKVVFDDEDTKTIFWELEEIAASHDIQKAMDKLVEIYQFTSDEKTYTEAERRQIREYQFSISNRENALKWIDKHRNSAVDSDWASEIAKLFDKQLPEKIKLKHKNHEVVGVLFLEALLKCNHKEVKEIRSGEKDER